jgi:hypothetical protein
MHVITDIMGYSQTNKKPMIACNLTRPEMQNHKATMIASLKANMLEKKELAKLRTSQIGIVSVWDKYLIKFILKQRIDVASRLPESDYEI